MTDKLSPLPETKSAEFAVNLTGSSDKNKRRELDFYPTPPDTTKALLDFLKLSPETEIWEPACGEGKMSKVMQEAGYSVVSTDIHKYSFGASGHDFLQATDLLGDWIITNPPFNLSHRFIEKAHELEPEGFAFLLKSQYWHAAKRFDLFDRIKPAYILPLTWRPDFLDGERGGAPTMECIWTVWMKGREDCKYIPLKREN